MIRLVEKQELTNNINYSVAMSKDTKDVADIADEAKESIVQVLCHQ